MRTAWGKTDISNGKFHPLVHHCMDVAAVFTQLTEQPVIRNRMETLAGGQLSDLQQQRLAALVFLHDVGKLHPGFQAKGWPKGLWKQPFNSHLTEGWEFLHLAHEKSSHPFHGVMEAMMAWGEPVPELLAAAIAHHGRPVAPPHVPRLANWPVLAHYDWQIEARQLADALDRWFPDAFERGGQTLPAAPAFQHLVAGLVALADWVGSDERFFNYEPELRADYNQCARAQARNAVEKVGLNPERLARQTAPDFTQLTGFAAPRPGQCVVGDIPDDARLVILEGETGSGKTEAAVWRFTQLFAAGKVTGLYFAVPTRAAARQLHKRVRKMMLRVFGARGMPTVLAIPGMLRADEHDGEKLPGWKVRWGDDRGCEGRFWAAEHAVRFLAAPVAVGTVDQAMLAGLQVKHAHLRGGALSRALLVVDEVHASDTYMSGILRPLLDAHLAAGGYAMLMSATLGGSVRALWCGQEPPSLRAAASAPYPAVWVKGEAEPRTAGGSTKSKAVRMRAILTMDSQRAAETAMIAAQSGGKVLVIRNTVGAALDTWRAVRNAGGQKWLMETGGGPSLHHSRFAAEDRALLDAAVERALHPRAGRRRAGGCIVIGTQTLEQSLDVDADFLITDLCPVDVLLQRIGRLHRHAVRRPKAHREPACHVLFPERGLARLTKPQFENGLGAWLEDRSLTGIYTDLAVLELTAELVSRQPVWQIPDDNRRLVEDATHTSRVEALLAGKGSAWRRYQDEHAGVLAAQRMLARLRSLNRNEPFGPELRFPSSDEQVMTRLGAEGPVVPLDPAPPGPFGTPVSRIAIPAHWAQGTDEWEAPEIRAQAGGFRLVLGDSEYSYTREGLTLQ